MGIDKHGTNRNPDNFSRIFLNHESYKSASRKRGSGNPVLNAGSQPLLLHTSPFTLFANPS